MKKTTKKKTASKKAIREGVALPKREFPAHLNTTPEEWRALKRTEWKEVTQAIHRYYHGSAFTPASSALYKLGIYATQITEAIESEEWIAW